MELVRHPASPDQGITGITVTGDVRRGMCTLEYRIAGEVPVLAPAGRAERRDGLWRHSCFELFVRPSSGQGYFEFNFAPSGAWAAYALSGYRAGMVDKALAPPLIERLDDGVEVTVDLCGLPAGEWCVGLSAVTEAADGSVAYWALAHPPSKADFHDPACFALRVQSDPV